jgi:hypothetical protein
MKNLTTQLAILLLSTLCLMTGAYAQITPLADAYTNTADPTTNYGAKTLLDVDGATQITYIQFNLASIPTGASISQATLKLYVNSVAKAGSFNVDYVNGSWSEGAIDSSNTPPLGTTIAPNVAITTADKNQYILVNITSAVQAWLNGSQANNGIALVANSTFNAVFDSKENTTTSHSAELDIAYAGGDGTITGVTTASGSGLMGGGTSGTLTLSLTDACAANQVLQWNGSAWACASAGTGTITGVTAGADLTGGGTSGNVTLSLNTAATNAVYAQLAAANTFTGNQTVNGNLTATGVVTGSAFETGGSYIAFGSYASGNAFLGFAGNTTTTGEYNTAIGLGALGVNTTGDSNTATGDRSLEANTSGYSNTANGWLALGNNTTGTANTAVGVQALDADTTGSGNTAVGLYALLSSTTGQSNTAIGSNALVSNTTGEYNTSLGVDAGLTADGSKLTGSKDTAIGTNAGFGTGSLINATAIGANAEVSVSNALVLGSINGVDGAGANVNVGIGTTAPAYSLDVHGTGNFTGAVAFGSPVTFAAGQTFPGTGTITGVSGTNGITGGGTSGGVILSLAANSCAPGNALTALPFSCSSFATLSANTFAGNQTVNGNLTATGAVTGSSFQIGNSLFAFGSYANANAFVGFAGNATMTGFDNTANGLGALNVNTTGWGNTANGWLALASNTAGNINTATGVGALSYNTTGASNTASGYYALYGNTTGNNNTASGYAALLDNATGQYNSALGATSGLAGDGSYITANNNTFLGAGSALSTGTLSNATAIGSNAVVSESNAIALGCISGVNSCTGSVSVGIGESSPSAPLHITGPAFAPPGALNAQNNGLLLGTNGTASYKWIQTYGGNLTLNPIGNSVGIGTSAPDTLLSVNGGADKPGGGSWGTFSDGRLKNLNGSYSSGLSQILRLNPIRYRYKADNPMGIHDYEEHVGVVAQEVQKVIPEAVTENSRGYLLVNNDPIIWAMLNAIKEQQRQITQQQNLLRAQTAVIRTLKVEIHETRETLRKVKAQVAAAQLTVVAEK